MAGVAFIHPSSVALGLVPNIWRGSTNKLHFIAFAFCTSFVLRGRSLTPDMHRASAFPVMFGQLLMQATVL